MQVLKFGGSSVANAENINKVVGIVQKALLKDKTVLVVSAFGGTTDMLIETGNLAATQNECYKELIQKIENRHLDTVRELLPIINQSSTLSLVKKKINELENLFDGVYLLQELSARTLDKIVSYGELLSSIIIAAKFSSMHVESKWLDARELIRTDSNFGNAKVDFETTNQNIRQQLLSQPENLFVLPGFISSDANKVTTTIGRGGSDYTGSILATAVDATVLEIWTDVSGMMTADPRLVNNVKAISHISYQEAMELSHFGAKVIYPPTMQPVMSKNIPVWIKNTFAPDDFGTLIEGPSDKNKNAVCGISSISKMALLSLEGSGMIGIPGFSKRLFNALSKEKINVILITQASSEHSICVGIEDVNIQKAKEAVDSEFIHEIKSNMVEPLIIESGLSIVALVGDNMKSHTGISGKMFSALGRNGVNIRAIAQGSSEKNISAVINTHDVKKAINVLHEAFFETAYKQVNLYIVGVGNVGSRLLEQLKNQQTYLLENLRLQLKVIGIANSRKMLFNEDGIDLSNWQGSIQNGDKMNFTEYVSTIYQTNLRNSVFIDITANEQVANVYKSLLKKSISVIACNKIACSSDYQNYSDLKNLAREYNSSFLYETNVGASLPIIGTLNDLMRSGDKVNKIEAALSGTLNFVFNNYDGTTPFAEVVKQAQTEGYTEPDPRVDLSGIDVMRKILILARESGNVMDLKDIACDSFLPEPCMNGDVANFYKELKIHEQHFAALYHQAKQKDCKLKFVARFENGKAAVGLQHISKDHDMFHLYGKDNVVLFYTNRYSQQPLVIKGAGAGAEVTASGIFADIMRTARV